MLALLRNPEPETGTMGVENNPPYHVRNRLIVKGFDIDRRTVRQRARQIVYTE
jgi:hypothetical protein